MVKQLRGKVLGVRIDSGDLLGLSREVRAILDADGLHDVKIFLSGDLNEYKIQDLVKNKAPAELFGVGTELVTSFDAPALGLIYKMVEISRGGQRFVTAKKSPNKITYPGRKHKYRISRK